MGKGSGPVWDLRRPLLWQTAQLRWQLCLCCSQPRLLCSPAPYLSQRELPLCLLGRIRLNVADKGLGPKLGQRKPYAYPALDCAGVDCHPLRGQTAGLLACGLKGLDYRTVTFWSEAACPLPFSEVLGRERAQELLCLKPCCPAAVFVKLVLQA